MTALMGPSDRTSLSSPNVTEAEEEDVVRAIRSGWVAPLGPEVDSCDIELAARLEREHCVVLSSGTAGLHPRLLTIGVQPDVVLTSSMTFDASTDIRLPAPSSKRPPELQLCSEREHVPSSDWGDLDEALSASAQQGVGL